MEIQVNYQGIELVLNGDYHEEEKEVNFSSCFDVEIVKTLEGSNITNLLSYDQIEDLQNLAIKKIE
jgi:hypothetical protein